MTSPAFTSSRRRWLCGCASLALLGPAALSGCGRASDGAGPAKAADFGTGASCALDGMVLAEYPGPKGQIQYADRDEVEWYCDTLEVLSVLRAPEQVRPLRAAFVQDMAKADWQQPRGHWVDARAAFYVLGSRRKGAMGATAISFAEQAAAQAFIAEHGGKVLRFDEVTAEMADLSGGALHDTRM